ncbi:hypothetical protein NEOLEDRAFT_1243003 [Neolentinus lepideus HHB14362 ss-1]|uniref:Uncharacterized protein n=1 Tax=Neolentinus lepideus HHB14362 ss-1 TaxID=1314782 RepID=A0A165RII8_9AGAM|nr:hypothetical protein NEOLEDRAFT_1243003 [Neolentinus lepideus HHB14362 ss-1]
MTDYEHDYEPGPRNIASYVASRKRVANWVKSHAAQPHNPADYFYSPSQPPSRIPSFLSDSSGAVEGDDEYDNESIYSVPPKMVLRFDDGRPDVIIEPSLEEKDHHARPARAIRGRSASASNVLHPKTTIPPPIRPTFFYNYGPPTPDFPEQIRVLPPLQPVPQKHDARANEADASRPNKLPNVTEQNSVIPYEKAQTIRPSSPRLGLSVSEPVSARFGYTPQSLPQTKDQNVAPQSYALTQRTAAGSGTYEGLDYTQYRNRQSSQQHPVVRQQQLTHKSRPSATTTASHPAPPGVAFSHSAPARLQSTRAGEQDYQTRQPLYGYGYNTEYGGARTSGQRERSSSTKPEGERGRRNYRSKSLPPPPPANATVGVGVSSLPGVENVPPRTQSRASVHSRGYPVPQPEARLRARFEDDTVGVRNGRPAPPRARIRHDSGTSASEMYYTGPGPGEYTQGRRTNSTQMSPSMSTSSTKYSPALSRPSTSGSGSLSFKKPFLQRIFPVGRLFDARKGGREREQDNDTASRPNRMFSKESRDD